MSLDEGTIVHCPRCGASILAMPSVDSATFHGDLMRVIFRPFDVEHACREGRQ